jgi:hypothetical protein
MGVRTAYNLEVITLRHFVTIRLSLNFIIGCWDYTFDREDRVSGETCVTVCIAVSRRIHRGRNDAGRESDRRGEDQ